MKLNINGFGKGEGIFSIFQKKELLFHPSREWIIGLSLSTFCLIGGLFFISLDFYNQFYGDADAVEIETHPMEYRAKDVHRYAEKYNTKEETFNTLRKNRVYVESPIVSVPITEIFMETSTVSTTTELVVPETLADDAVEQ